MGTAQEPITIKIGTQFFPDKLPSEPVIRNKSPSYSQTGSN